MAFTEFQKNLLRADHTDVETQVLVGGPRATVDKANAEEGGTVIPLFFTVLDRDWTAADTTLYVQDVRGFRTANGSLWISGIWVTYTGISGNSFTGIKPLASAQLPIFRPIVDPTQDPHFPPTLAVPKGTQIYQFVDISDKVQSVDITCETGENEFKFRCSLTGWAWDSTVIIGDNTLVVRKRYYNSIDRHWSKWEDVFIGWIDAPTVTANINGTDWSASAEGLSKYLSLSTYDGGTFGDKRLNDTVSISAKAFSTLGTPALEPTEGFNPVNFQAANVVDRTHRTLWCGANPVGGDHTWTYRPTGGEWWSVYKLFQVYANPLPIQGYSTRDLQFIVLYSAATPDPPPGQSPDGLSIRNSRGEFMSFQILSTDPPLLPVWGGGFMVLCRDPAVFNQVYGQVRFPVVGWGGSYPKFTLDPFSDYLYLVKSGRLNNNGGGEAGWVVDFICWEHSSKPLDPPERYRINKVPGWAANWLWYNGTSFEAPLTAPAVGQCFQKPRLGVEFPTPTELVDHANGQRQPKINRALWQKVGLSDTNLVYSPIPGGLQGTGFDYVALDLGEFTAPTATAWSWNAATGKGTLTVTDVSHFPPHTDGSYKLYIDQVVGVTVLAEYDDVNPSTNQFIGVKNLKQTSGAAYDGASGIEVNSVIKMEIDDRGPSQQDVNSSFFLSANLGRRIGNFFSVSRIRIKRWKIIGTPSVIADGRIYTSVKVDPYQSGGMPETGTVADSIDSQQLWALRGSFVMPRDPNGNAVEGELIEHDIVFSPYGSTKWNFAQHIAVQVRSTSDFARPKVNEIEVYESTFGAHVSGTESVSDVIRSILTGKRKDGTVTRYTRNFGLVEPNEVIIKDYPAPVKTLPISRDNYWNILVSLAKKTGGIVGCDALSRIVFYQDPRSHHTATYLPEHEWTTENIWEGLQVVRKPNHQVSQVEVVGYDAIGGEELRGLYPAVAHRFGEKVVLTDALVITSDRVKDLARIEYLRRNNGWTITVTTGPIMGLQPFQRHTITAIIDEARVYLKNMNVYVQSFTQSFKHNIETTTITFEEIIYA